MRIIMMHKHDDHTEAGELPGPELMANMGAFMTEHTKAGRFKDGAGLGATKTRTLLTFEGGSCRTRTPYPRRGGNELPATVLELTVKTRDQALGWAERYGKILVNGAIELSKMTEMWDLGLMPEPPDAPLRYLLVEKASAATEKGTRDARQKADLARLKTEMKKEGVLHVQIDLAPSASGKRLHFRNDELSVVDGPFTESKELIGGYSVMELTDLDEAIAICKPYAKILGGNLEIDVRVIDQMTY